LEGKKKKSSALLESTKGKKQRDNRTDSKEKKNENRMQPSQKESPRGVDSPNGHPSSPNLENEKPKGKTEKKSKRQDSENRPWENRTQKRSSERK